MTDWMAGKMEWLLDFSNILNDSIAASWLVLAVVVLRFLLKKAPRWTHVALWGLVAVRLLLPFSIESAFSLIPSTETVPQEILRYEGQQLQEQAYLDVVTNPVISDGIAVEIGQTVDRVQVHMVNLSFIWLAGIAALLIYTAVSYWGLRRKVSEAVILRDNIYQSENAGSPFVLGVFKPKIYLPYNMDEQDLSHVVAHEQAHIRRKDHWWKPLGFLLLTLHWFNPVMWLAYVLLCRDIELACDEKVIKELGNEQRADYTQALVACSVNRRMIAACPLAFGEVGVKERVKSVMNYKKPAFWIVVVAVIACAVVAVCFLTNPVKPQDSLELIDRDTPAGANEAVYSASFGNQVQGGLIYAEQWSNGECVRSSPVMLTQNVEKIGVRTDVRKEAGASVGVDVQIDTYGLGGSLITYFAFPEANAFLGWSFTARELNEPVTVTAQEDIILAAMAFDTGNGVRAFDCQTLESEPERLENADYMIVIRACFNNIAMQYNQAYGVVEVTYESLLTSFSMVAQQNTPEYMLDEDYHLFSVKEYSEAPNWTDLGEISEITITKENFDDLFRTNSGDGWLTRESASAIRRNTAKAWSVIYNQEKLYYILQQKNGELYLAYGYYDYSEKDDPGSDDTYIRWLYKLAPQTSENVLCVKIEDHVAGATQEPRYNIFDLRPFDGEGVVLPGVYTAKFLINEVEEGVTHVTFDVPLYQDGYETHGLQMKAGESLTLRTSLSDEYTAYTFSIIGMNDAEALISLGQDTGAIREITDPTDNPNFSYDTAVEKIFEDANNEYFIGGLYSQHIIVHYTDGTQEDIVTALNAGRATFADLDRFGIRYWAEPKADPLEAAISSAILDHYASKQPDGLIHVESHVLLANEVKSGTPLLGVDNHIEEVTVYLLVFHEKYSTYGGTPEAVGGSYVPTAITFSVSESEEYTLKEYWEPRDGSYYAKDVQAKFPGASAEDALNDQAYIDDLQAQNYSKALAYLNSNGGLEIRIAELLDTICASPGVFASSPAQYIDAHEAEYQELLDYREYTLRFCFSEFLRGGQTDLRSHIMRAAIDDIAPEAQLRLYAETGQAYFDEWKAAALRVGAQHEMEWIEKNQPAIYLLLQMLDREMVADADAEIPQLSFAGLAHGETLIDEEVFEISTNSTELEYRLTYTSPTIILEVGVVAKDGTEFSATIQDGTGTGSIENIPAGRYQLFVRNVGCISDLPGKTVEGGAMVCKLIEKE